MTAITDNLKILVYLLLSRFIRVENGWTSDFESGRLTKEVIFGVYTISI